MSNELNKYTAPTMELIPDAGEWGTIYNMAKALVPTGFLPEGIKTPEQATAIILKGRELRIAPMYALSNIHVIKGKPTVSAELMLALVQRDHGMNAMWVEESTNEYCKVGYRVGKERKMYVFSINDAKTAGLTKSPTWISYPAAMLRARAISAVARMAFPGTIAGMYVHGELGDDVVVDSEGTVMSAALSDDGPPRMTGKVETVVVDTGEIIDADQDGPLEGGDMTPAEANEWVDAAKYLATLVKKHKITDDEGRAMLRKWGIATAKVEDMTTEQIRKACTFLDNNSNPKKYAERALADEQELEAINQAELLPAGK